MKEIILSTNTYDGILKHLVDIEERQNQIEEEILIKSNGEYQEYTNILNNYLIELRELVENSNKTDGIGNEIPLVTIGAMVHVRHINTQTERDFHIVSPYSRRSISGDVSCLSPVGKALLLKRVGESVLVTAPGGTSEYLIQSIQYVGE